MKQLFDVALCIYFTVMSLAILYGLVAACIGIIHLVKSISKHKKYNNDNDL